MKGGEGRGHYLFGQAGWLGDTEALPTIVGSGTHCVWRERERGGGRFSPVEPLSRNLTFLSYIYDSPNAISTYFLFT